MKPESSAQNAEQPFYPYWYSPEIEESDTGYDLLHIEQFRYSGPIPSPETMDYYEQVLPGDAGEP